MMKKAEKLMNDFVHKKYLFIVHDVLVLMIS